MNNIRMILSTILKRTILLLMLLITTVVVFAQDFPAVSKRLVSDFTNTLSSQEISALEHKLVGFNDTTSTQIAVVLINTTDGYDIADYAVRLAKKWGVGESKYNNGIMLLAAINDRAVTIQTGYGIEGALPDAIAYRIIENDIKPNFRINNYYGGLDEATNSIISYTKGEYNAEPRREQGEGGGIPTIFIIIAVFVIIALISKRGGGNNGGGRMINGKGSSDLFWWMLLNGMGNNNRGGGGFGGGFGGGGDSGGFGGFGGGDFGGGGASGRW